MVYYEIQTHKETYFNIFVKFDNNIHNYTQFAHLQMKIDYFFVFNFRLCASLFVCLCVCVTNPRVSETSVPNHPHWEAGLPQSDLFGEAGQPPDRRRDQQCPHENR